MLEQRTIFTLTALISWWL